MLQLQQRLAALKYYPGPADGQFGPDTEEAVWAFQETQGLPASGTVGPQMQAALADPASPAVLVPDGPATRVEVNLADGTTAVFRVTGVRQYLKSTFPASTIYGATDYAALRLITCGGAFDPATRHYLSSIIVFASLSSYRPASHTTTS